MKLATIERIEALEPISNFDRIELATVAGYKVVVPKGKHTVGELVIYVATDTVLPDTPLFEPYRKYAKKRVKTARIGNKELGYVWSQGLILDITTFLPDYDISHILGITKFEEPAPQQLDAKGKLPYGIPKTDEERYQNVKTEYEHHCDVTLKIDGTSFTVYYNLETDIFGVCGRTLEYKLDCNNNYTKIVNKYDLDIILPNYCKKYNVSLALRGEMYGKGIQAHKSNYHSKLDLDVAFYSVYNLTTGKYENTLDEHYFEDVCSELRLPTVKIVEYNVSITDYLIKYYEELELLNIDPTIEDVPFEGVVIKTPTMSFKVINKYYDMYK